MHSMGRQVLAAITPACPWRKLNASYSVCASVCALAKHACQSVSVTGHLSRVTFYIRSINQWMLLVHSIDHTKKRVLPQPFDRGVLMRPPVPVHELLQEQQQAQQQQQQQQQAQHQLQHCQVAPHGLPTSTSAVSMHPSANLYPDSIRTGFGGFLDALTPSDEEERRSRAAVNKVNTALHKAALKGADWNVEGAAKAAGSHGRKTHLRGRWVTGMDSCRTI